MGVSSAALNNEIPNLQDPIHKEELNKGNYNYLRL